MSKEAQRVITFGTFDLFHFGHLRMLERAAAMGGHLTVGVSTDALNRVKKGATPVFSEYERREIVGALACVDETFWEESLEQKRDYVLEHRADVLVMGDDWVGRFDHLEDVCRVAYLPRTPGISTGQIREVLREEGLRTLREGTSQEQ